MLKSDFNGDFEQTIEAEILQRIEALPAGHTDDRLMKLLRFASGRRPWLKVEISMFDSFNAPDVRFKVYEDANGELVEYDNLLTMMAINISADRPKKVPQWILEGGRLQRMNPDARQELGLG
jgi:hypothetical protein